MIRTFFQAVKRGLLLVKKGAGASARAFFDAVAKGFENFFLIEKHHYIPARLEEEYNQQTAELIKAKIKLFCSLGIAIVFLIGIFGYFVLPFLSLRGAVILSLAIGAAVAILLLNRMAGRLPQLRLIGYLLSFAFAMAVGSYYLISPYSSLMGTSGLLITLLTTSFMFPWTFRQTYLICFINILVYLAVSNMIGRMTNQPYFFLDLLLLVVASMIACAVRRSDDIRRQKEFVLNRELAEKTAIIEKDLLLARQLHQSLLPESIQTEEFEIAVNYLPMHHIGGDFGKIYHPNDHLLTLFICDITGHGVSSALLVNRIHTEIENLLRDSRSPGSLLAHLDTFVKRSFAGFPMFLSAFCAQLDFRSGKILYSNYGHPPQILLNKNGTVKLMKPETALIGIEQGIRKGDFYEEDLSFQRGDRLILYTDGILETRGDRGESFGLERLLTFARSNMDRSVQVFNKALLERLEDYREGEASDDIFIISVQTKGGAD